VRARFATNQASTARKTPQVRAAMSSLTFLRREVRVWGQTYESSDILWRGLCLADIYVLHDNLRYSLENWISKRILLLGISVFHLSTSRSSRQCTYIRTCLLHVKLRRTILDGMIITSAGASGGRKVSHWRTLVNVQAASVSRLSCYLGPITCIAFLDPGEADLMSARSSTAAERNGS
jgi:hypothetical protein